VTLLALGVTGRGLVDPDEPAVFADDEAFLRGRAAFETVRVYRGRPFRLDAHLERLAESARRLGLPGVDLRGLRALVEAALGVARTADAVLRFYWTPGREGEDRASGLVLGSGLLGGVKSTSYALNMVAVDEAKRRGADDAVFVGAERVVLECPTANIWWRRGRTLLTPGLALGILAGVTRGVVLELAPELGYDVREGSFGLGEVSAAEEAFTTSSVREVMPVAALDGSAVRLGSAAEELQRSIRRLASA